MDAWRWVVVWGERWEREALFADRALAEAYAAAHHGVLVPVAALVDVPRAAGAGTGVIR